MLFLTLYIHIKKRDFIKPNTTTPYLLRDTLYCVKI